MRTDASFHYFYCNKCYNIHFIAQFNQPVKNSKQKETVRSRIRPIGNSKGVLFNAQLLKAAGIGSNDEVTIAASDGVITITKAAPEVNTDLSTWDQQFKKAIKKGDLPEGDLFEGLQNEFDKKEW